MVDTVVGAGKTRRWDGRCGMDAPNNVSNKPYDELTTDEKRERRLQQNRMAAKRSYEKRVARQAGMEVVSLWLRL